MARFQLGQMGAVQSQPRVVGPQAPSNLTQQVVPDPSKAVGGFVKAYQDMQAQKRQASLNQLQGKMLMGDPQAAQQLATMDSKMYMDIMKSEADQQKNRIDMQQKENQSQLRAKRVLALQLEDANPEEQRFVLQQALSSGNPYLQREAAQVLQLNPDLLPSYVKHSLSATQSMSPWIQAEGTPRPAGTGAGRGAAYKPITREARKDSHWVKEYYKKQGLPIPDAPHGFTVTPTPSGEIVVSPNTSAPLKTKKDKLKNVPGTDSRVQAILKKQGIEADPNAKYTLLTEDNRIVDAVPTEQRAKAPKKVGEGYDKELKQSYVDIRKFDPKTNRYVPERIYQGDPRYEKFRLKFAEKQAGFEAKNLQTINQKAETGRQTIQQMSTALDIERDAFEGTFANVLTKVGGMAGFLQDVFGFDAGNLPAKASVSEALRGIFNAEQLNRSEILKGTLSDSDMAILRSAGPALSQTAEGRRLLMKILMRTAERYVRRAELANEYTELEGEFKLGAFNKWAGDRLRTDSVLEPSDYAHLLNVDDMRKDKQSKAPPLPNGRQIDFNQFYYTMKNDPKFKDASDDVIKTQWFKILKEGWPTQ